MVGGGEGGGGDGGVRRGELLAHVFFDVARDRLIGVRLWQHHDVCEACLDERRVARQPARRVVRAALLLRVEAARWVDLDDREPLKVSAVEHVGIALPVELAVHFVRRGAGRPVPRTTRARKTRLAPRSSSSLSLSLSLCARIERE